jgi:fatty acid desaturase
MEGAGGDCTELWESNHPLRLANNGPPKAYLIGTVRDYKPFSNWKGDFYNELKGKVEKEIPRERRRSSWIMYAHAGVLLVLYLLSLYLFIVGPNWKTMIFYCFIAGQFAVNIHHDGSHFGFTDSKRVNWWASVSLELIGSSSLLWARSHNVAHHPYTQQFERESYICSFFKNSFFL